MSTRPDAARWEQLKKLPVRMFQTPRGPIMGLLEREVTRGVRLWAPAWVNMPSEANVIWLPVAFVETYFDLYWNMLIGTHDIPELVEKGYRGFVEQFIKGSYQMKPVITSAGVDADPHTVELPKVETAEAAPAETSPPEA